MSLNDENELKDIPDAALDPIERMEIVDTATAAERRKHWFWGRRRQFKSENVQSDNVQPKKEPQKKVGYFQLFRFCQPLDYLLLTVGIVCAVINGAMFPLMSYFIGNVTTAVASGQTNTPIPDPSKVGLTTFILFIVLGIVSFLASYLQTFVLTVLGERQAKFIRINYFTALMKSEWSFHDLPDNKTGGLSSRLTADVNLIKEGMGDKLAGLVSSISATISGFAIGFALCPPLAGVLVAIFPLLIILGFFMSRFIMKAVTAQQKALAEVGAYTTTAISQIRTVQAFGAEEKEISWIDKHLLDAKRHGEQRAKVAAVGIGLIMGCVFASFGLGFFFAGKLVTSGDDPISSGVVLSVFLSTLIGVMSLGGVAPNFSAMSSAQGAAYELFNTIDRQSAIDPLSTIGEKPNVCQPPTIEFKNVSFSYPTRPEIKVLDDFNLVINAGQRVALVGSSGVGKSSICKLLLRAYDVNQGSITYDGVDVKDYNVGHLRRRMGVVQQEPSLFSTSIWENVAMGLYEFQKVPQEEMDNRIHDALIQANAGFVFDMPEGVSTLVGDRGIQISGGERQRISIARALISQPSMYILDEATSALDTKSERLVQNALDRLGKDKTVIVIAHRLSTIANCDLICVMEAGKIVEKGTHAQLLALGGKYSSMVAAQSLKLEDTVQEEDIGHIVDAAVAKLNGNQMTSTARRMVTVKELEDEDKRKKKLREKTYLTQDVPYGKLLNEAKPDWLLYLIGSIADIFHGATTPLFSLIFAQMVASFALSGSALINSVNFWASMFGLLGLANFFIYLFGLSTFGIAGERLAYRLRLQCFTSMLSQEISWFDKEENAVGTLNARLADDATKVKLLLADTVPVLIRSLVVAIGGLLVAFLGGWKLTLVILACTPLLFIASRIQIKTQNKYHGRSKVFYESTGKTSNEAITHIRTVHQLGQEEYFITKYVQELQQPFVDSIKSSMVTSAGSGINQAIMFGIFGLAFWYGSVLVQAGEMTASQMNTVIYSVIFSAASLGQNVGWMPSISKAQIAAVSLYDIIDRTPTITSKIDGIVAASDAKRAFALENVDFTYPSRPDVQVLKQVSLQGFPQGKYALVGHSGSGKSTVVGLFERFYDTISGIVSVDDVNVKDWNLSTLRRNMGLVSQEPSLSPVSIRDNITYGMTGSVTEEEIHAALKIANLEEFISSLPDGLETNTGAMGSQVSGGQKQRIAVARAIIRQPKLLLLDEASSALDSASEKLVQKALDKASSLRTTIQVAHRLSTIQDSDCIFVFDKGQIVEYGNHEELMQKRGLYFELVRQQSLAVE